MSYGEYVHAALRELDEGGAAYTISIDGGAEAGVSAHNPFILAVEIPDGSGGAPKIHLMNLAFVQHVRVTEI